MSNKIKAGDSVKIIDIHKDSAHWDERKSIVGQTGEITGEVQKLGGGWIGILIENLKDIEGFPIGCIHGCKIRRVKK